MTLPTLTLGISWTQNPGSDTPGYTNIEADTILELATQRGRNEEQSTTEPGVSPVLLSNQTRDFDPSNSSGLYYPNVIPVRTARLLATIFSTNYDLVVGDIEDWPQKYTGRQNQTPIRILDGLDAMNGASFSATRSVEYSGTRIGAILDAIGWSSSQRSVDTGLSPIQAITYDNANALSSLQDVADAEGGLFFIDASGNAVFHSRDRRWKDSTVQAVFSNVPSGSELPLSSVELLYRRDKIRNKIVLTRDGGSTYTLEDSTSEGKYRTRDFTKTYILENESECSTKAEYLLGLYKDAILRPDTLVLEPQQDDNLWAQCLGREVSDRIQVKVQPPGTPTETLTFDCYIENIAQNYTRGRWVTTMRLSPADLYDFWIIGTSQLGVDTRLGY